MTSKRWCGETDGKQTCDFQKDHGGPHSYEERCSNRTNGWPDRYGRRDQRCILKAEHPGGCIFAHARHPLRKCSSPGCDEWMGHPGKHV